MLMKKMKLRWVLAHIPYDLFLRSAAAFAKKAHEISNGAIEIDVMGIDQYQKKYAPNTDIKNLQGFALVNSGAIEMSQTYNAVLGSNLQDLRALDMPYLFDNHEQATRVLDGPIGLAMLKGLENRSNVRGLAFTYSGGFRIMVSNQPLNSVDAINGQRVRVSYSPVAVDTFGLLGAKPVSTSVADAAEAQRDNLVDMGENTWARFFRTGVNKYVTHAANTKHSLFLTSIIINKKIWNDFTPETREMLQVAALEAAEAERKESLIDAEAVMKQAKESGIVVTDWSNDQQNEMKEKTASVYDKYAKTFTPKLLDKIKNS
jgi:TRAP-type C4-dicarboxylate transport system substrate-binding protein